MDADVKELFDHIDHEWAIGFIESRIKDQNIKRLVRRMQKAGIMKDYQNEEKEEGSSQNLSNHNLSWRGNLKPLAELMAESVAMMYPYI